MKRIDLTEGAIFPALARLAWPLVLGNWLQLFYNLTDMFWVGRVSTEAVAAISLSFPTVWMSIAIGTGTSIAGAALVAQYIGAGENRRANRVAGQAVTLAVLASGALAAIAIPARGWLLTQMGATAETLPLASDYLGIIFAGLPFAWSFFALWSVLRGAGDALTPMWLMVISTGLNMILDPFLILGWAGLPALGLRGAAIATLLSRGVAAGAGLYLLFSGRRGIHVSWKDLWPELPLIKQLVKIGAPASLDGAVRSLSAVVMISIVARFGTIPVAAFGVVTRVMSVVWTTSMGIGQAVGTTVGQNLGARRPERAERAAWGATALDFALLTVGGLLFFAFPKPVISIFIKDREVIEAGASFLRIIVLASGFWGSLSIIQGAFQGAGRTVPAMICSLLQRWVIPIPLALLFGFTLDFGVHGVLWAMVIGFVMSALIGVLWFRLGHWKTAVIGEVELEVELTGDEVPRSDPW
ncbi:MAG: MATE family efflux transporter [Candidatus Bipolaricaulia bacterium]